jgi:hypothetical protein
MLPVDFTRVLEVEVPTLCFSSFVRFSRRAPFLKNLVFDSSAPYTVPVKREQSLEVSLRSLIPIYVAVRTVRSDFLLTLALEFLCGMTCE